MAINNATFINNAIWSIHQRLKKLGLWGILAIAIALLSLVIYSVKMHRMNEITRVANAEFERLQIQKNLSSQSAQFSQQAHAQTDGQNTHQEIAHFYQTLPSAEHLPEILLKINTYATAQKLSLNSGNYTFNKSQDDDEIQAQPIIKYEVTLPVKGQYNQIRAFISQMLFDFPSLALVDLTFKRESLQHTEVEAALVLIIYVKEYSDGH